MFRDSSGKWLLGFAKHVGVSSAYLAELWGVYEGLKLAKSKGYLRLELQLDSKTVADSLNIGNQGSHNGWSLLRNIRSLLSPDFGVKFIHIYREANEGADFFANIGCNLDLDPGLEILSSPLWAFPKFGFLMLWECPPLD